MLRTRRGIPMDLEKSPPKTEEPPVTRPPRTAVRRAALALMREYGPVLVFFYLSIYQNPVGMHTATSLIRSLATMVGCWTLALESVARCAAMASKSCW